MANPFKWLEKKIFTGDILHDYGIIHKEGVGVSNVTHSVLLCRKAGKEIIVIRHSYRALLAFSISYTEIPANKAERLAEIFIDIAARQASKLEPKK